MKKHYWVKRMHWARGGKVHTHVQHVTSVVFEMAMQQTEAPPVGYGNHWFEHTRWWMHKRGWQFLFGQIHQGVTNAATRVNKSLETPIGKFILNVTAGVSIYVIGRFIYERVGF